MPIASVNPTTGETLRVFTAETADQTSEKIARATAAFPAWRRLSFAERGEVLRAAAGLLENEVDALARLATTEMGKTLRSAREELAKCAVTCRHYAAHAENDLRAEEVAGPDQTVRYEPLGVVLAVMPWNFPFWQLIRFAAPALAAGNVALLKHASNVPQCALALADLFHRAGAPGGVFQALLIGSDAVEAVVADPRVAAITLTGSEAAGRSIAAQAGAHLKKAVLELGGSDPFIVLPTADLDEAVTTAVKARVVNNGQSCIAAKRFIIDDVIYDRFVSAFLAQMRALTVGDPMDASTDVGPLATRAIRDEVAAQVDRSVSAGARLLLGGRVPPGSGNFYPPTVLEQIPARSPAAREEIFGPVAALFRARDAADALALANASGFGLGASVWTRDRGEAAWFARELETGSVFVNDMVASDPRFPFGGVKRSGYGRELGAWGPREFMNVKTVRMRFSQS